MSVGHGGDRTTWRLGRREKDARSRNGLCVVCGEDLIGALLRIETTLLGVSPTFSA
jgi:hypothetical protein